MVNETALAEYKQTSLITQEHAMDIIRTTPGWEKAPVNVVKRAAMICASYRVFPGVHVFLLPFGEGTAKSSWAVAFGIKANRLLASRRKAWKQVDGPRIAKPEEAQEHFLDQYDSKLIYAVCRLEGLDGSTAEGWGTWPRDKAPYGIDKGNSKANMAEIRAERRALDRLCPGELPTDVYVVDEAYITSRETPTIREVDQVSGEITEGEVSSPSEGEELPHTEAVLPQPETPKAVSRSPQKSSPTVKSFQQPYKIGKDPTKFKPKNLADVIGGAAYFFGVSGAGVFATLGVTDGSGITNPEEAWDAIMGENMEGEPDAS